MHAVCMFYNLGHFRNLDRNLQMAQGQNKGKSFPIKAVSMALTNRHSVIDLPSTHRKVQPVRGPTTCIRIYRASY